ncbi:MAG: Ni/Fe-hydrogenase cytochrome b subunit [Armatimonadetes bacterium]|nr:Ni/Fe-hydrogenase cytochrome b subunit [Armatimonadota bacterium]
MRPRPSITFWRAMLIIILGAGIYSLVARFVYGLGATTALSDAYPWGLWIGFDVLCGVGLSAGGFTLAAMVYVFRLEKYRAILRASLLTAFLGYLLVIVSLLCDLGLPYRIWHPLIMGNLHSPLFEVAMCVMFYTGVLALEFSPALLERLGLQTPLRWIHAAIVPLVITGVLLSTLHQSSLGTLFLIVPNKLHGLWYSPLLPLFFFVSAVGAGLSMVIFESYLSHRAFGTGVHRDILQGLAKASAGVLLLGLAIRLADLLARGKAGLVLEGSLESRMFLLEVALGSVLPIAFYLTPRVRGDRTGLFLAALLALCGFVLNRLNVSFTGVQRSAGQAYFPTWMEMAITIAIIACGFLAFGMAARYLPVFPSPQEGSEEGVSYAPLLRNRPAGHPGEAPIATPAGIAFLSGLAMFFALAAIFVRANEAAASPSGRLGPSFPRLQEVAARMATVPLRVPAEQRFPQGAVSPGTVVFRHATHVNGQHLACETCHAELFLMSRPASAGAGHTIDTMDRCQSCHNGVDAFEVRDGCGFCHSSGSGITVSSVTARQIAPPADFQFTSQKQSLGPVPFSHRQHLAHVNDECTACHPALFGMVAPENGPLKMPAMRQGEGCGKCHNGRDAFTVATDCALCHRGSSPSPGGAVAHVNRVPEDRVRRVQAAPGPVTFSHRAHLSRGGTCSTCHPALFGMVSSPDLRMASMKEGRQCGFCHNGKEAFTVASDCGLCHATPRKPTVRPVASSNAQAAPADYRFPTGEGSPGAVTFSHARHRGYTENGCAGCHSRLFPMRRPESGACTMAKMGGGQQCGACHNGTRAFALEDCLRCHATQPN